MNSAFGDLHPRQFPLTMQFVSHRTGEVIKILEVPKAGAVRIPTNAELGGGWIGVRIYFGDGTVIYRGPHEAGMRER